jgi:hypothetical protein
LARKIWINSRKFYDCQVEGCKNKHYAKHYCQTHYVIFVTNGGYKLHKCLVKDCNKKTHNPKYCSKHSLSNSKHRSLDLSIKYTCRGSKNYMWKGGVAEYPNHYLMKQRRLVLLKKYPLCRICHKKPSIEIHHKDGDKSNHAWKNLLPSCHKCNSSIRFAPNNSKFFRKYGINLQKLADKIKFSYVTIWHWEKQRLLEGIIKSNPTIFSLDKRLNRSKLIDKYQKAKMSNQKKDN